jgi:hypothetical protein
MKKSLQHARQTAMTLPTESSKIETKQLPHNL